MALTVREIMNPELFTLPETMSSGDALDALLDLEITAAPVVDSERRPVGVATLRDLIHGSMRPGRSPTPTPTPTPPLSVSASLSIEAAARMMGDNDLHHLLVVGSDGRVSGLVSSYDLMRALIGLPPHFPATFPHRDSAFGVTWSDLAPFDGDHVSKTLPGAGVLVLTTGGQHQAEADVWAEAAPALRDRLTALIERTQEDPALVRVLARRDLRFRYACIEEAAHRERVASRLRLRIERAPYARGVSHAEG